MNVIIDTNALIAAMLTDHQHHSKAVVWLNLAQSKQFGFYVSSHTLTEVYSVLTKLPRKPQILPREAESLIQDNIINHATILALNAHDYWPMVQQVAQLGLLSGMVFDAITATTAERFNMDRLLTINVKHYERVWPSGIGKIISPLTTAP